MPRHLSDLPGRELCVDLLGQGRALFLQALNLLGDVDGRVVLDVAQLFDFCLELGDRLVDIEEGRLLGGKPRKTAALYREWRGRPRLIARPKLNTRPEWGRGCATDTRLRPNAMGPMPRRSCT